MGDLTNTEKHVQMLRARALERVESGVLPRAKAARSWGGRGSGLACSLCDLPIATTTTEMELEFDGAVSCTSVRFHLQCQSVWESVRRVQAEGDWLALDKRQPPFDTVVEARLDLGGSKSVILGVVRARGRAGEAIWLNATTNSRLPAAWHPVEWRTPTGLELPEESAAPKRA